MQRMYRKQVMAVAVAAFTVLAIGTTACGNTVEADPTPVKTWKITPAPSGQASPTPEPSATPGDASTPPAGDGTEFTIEGLSNAFDVEELTAPAGPITIIFDNRDSGIVHNIHFFEGDDADGESVGETELEVGPIEQTLEMTLEPGTYFYQCDAHPQTMTGTLEVT